MHILFLHLCLCLHSSLIEYLAIGAVVNFYGVGAVLEGISQHGRENHAEQCGGQHTPLFYAIRDLEGFRCLTPTKNSHKHSIVE